MVINLNLIASTWIALNRTNRRLTVNKLEYKRKKYFFRGRCWLRFFLGATSSNTVHQAIGATCTRCSTAFSKSCTFRLSLISLVAKLPQRHELVFLGRLQRRLEGFFLSEDKECPWTKKNINNDDRCFKIRFVNQFWQYWFDNAYRSSAVSRYWRCVLIVRGQPKRSYADGITKLRQRWRKVDWDMYNFMC